MYKLFAANSHVPYEISTYRVYGCGYFKVQTLPQYIYFKIFLTQIERFMKKNQICYLFRDLNIPLIRMLLLFLHYATIQFTDSYVKSILFLLKLC